MIGDWIGLDSAIPHFEDKEVRIEQEITPCQVVKFDDYQVVVKRPDKQFQVVLYDAISPIQLTKEILERNDFLNIGQQVIQYKNGLYWVWVEEDTMRLGIDANNDSWDGEATTPMLRLYINYVHQLQHALSLCNINKEIKI